MAVICAYLDVGSKHAILTNSYRYSFGGGNQAIICAGNFVVYGYGAVFS